MWKTHSIITDENLQEVPKTYAASKEPDFLAQKSYLAEALENEGFNIIFYPKYRCELNYIELVWGWIKRYHRDTCTYNFRDLERDLPRTVEEIIPLRFVKKAARRVLRYAEGYRLKKIGPDLEAYVTKNYKKLTEDLLSSCKILQITKLNNWNL